MSQRKTIGRKTLLASAALITAMAFCAVAWALPTGGWVLTSEFECNDPNLVCAEWEFAGGGTTEPCCVTMGNYAANRPYCTSSDFR